ncbi:MAG TPA: VOC family protein [Streptosporangiaceae bacterium]|nr:VOC family protein [Streptosporangiaceae bacterium]
MTMSVIGLSIDCADAATLAGFWSEALGRPVNPGAHAEHAAINATDPASGPRLSFQKVPEPKTVKNRLHLDLRTDRFEAESDRLTGLGATAIRSFDRPTMRWTTFADPKARVRPDSSPGPGVRRGPLDPLVPSFVPSAAHAKVTWSIRPPSGSAPAVTLTPSRTRHGH